jgi:hypothetical protein
MPMEFNCAIKSTFDCPDNIREDVLDVMVNLSPTRTPFFSSWRKGVAKAVNHEWQVDSLSRTSDPDAPVVPCARESMDFDFEDLDCPCRVGNQVHILRRTGDVSWLQRAVATIGYSDEYAYQVDRQMKKLALDTEFALIHSVRGGVQTVPQDEGICGSPNECRTMDGVLALAGLDSEDFECLDDMKQGTVIGAPGLSPCLELTPYLLDDLLQVMYHKGAEVDNVYVNTTLKRKISSWYFAGQIKNLQAADQKLINSVDYYESDFGRLAVNIHLDMPTDALLALDSQYMQIDFAYPTRVMKLAQMSNSDKFGIEHALTLVARALVALGVLRGLCTDNVMYCDPCFSGDDATHAPQENLPR